MEINKRCDVVRETSFAIQLIFVSFGFFFVAMRVFVWLAHKNEHFSLNVGNVLERKTCTKKMKWPDSSTDRHG